MFLLGNIGQQIDIEELRTEVHGHRRDTRLRLGRSVKELAAQVQELQAESESLKLYVAALIRLVAKHGIATTEELVALVDAIDGEDGQVDGANQGVLPGRATRPAKPDREPGVGSGPAVPTRGVRLRPRHRR
jgi:hypothetical protein